MKKILSISKKLIIVMCVFLILTFGLAFSSYYIAKQYVTNKIEDMGQVVVNEISLSIDNYLLMLFSLCKSLSVSISNMYDIQQNINYQSLLQKHFQETNIHGVQTIFMGLENGYFVDANNWIPPKNYDPRIRPWYVDAYNKGTVIVTDPYVDAITNLLIISVSTPIFHKEKIIGVVGLDINLQYLEDKLINKVFLNNGYPFLIDKKGYFIMSSLSRFTMSENISILSKNVNLDLATIGKKILQQKQGMNNLILNDKDMIIFYSSVSDYFIFGMFFDKQLLYSFAKEIANQYIISGILIIVFLLILLLPIIYDINNSFKSLSITICNIIHKLKNNLDMSETAYNVQLLAKEIKIIMSKINVLEFKFFLESMYQVLHTIGIQSEEIAALTEETVAIQNELLITNKELQKRQMIWKSTLKIMDTLNMKDKTQKKVQNIAQTILENTKAFGVLLARLEDGFFHNIAYVGYKNDPEIKVVSIEKSISGKACIEQKSIWVEDVTKEKDYVLVHKQVISELEIPLLYRGESKGILEVAFDTYQIKNEELIETLLPVASAISSLLEIELAHVEIKESYKYLVKKLQHVTEIYHLESADHMERISKYVRFLAQLLNKTKEEQDDIDIFSRLHDIGKLRIPLSILAKNGPLTEEEMDIIRTHPLCGAELVGNAKWLNMARTICLTHHEKWDGSGYPIGLKEDNIPWEGQVVALADVYDALRSVRVYKNSMSHNDAVNVILNGDGRTKPEHFNPLLLKLFKEYHYEFDNIFNNLSIGE